METHYSVEQNLFVSMTVSVEQIQKSITRKA